MERIEDPLFGPPPKEVPLANAPLVRVIAQVRFPLVLAVDQSETIAPFQKALADRYPILNEERIQTLTNAGGPPPPAQVVWRFSDEGEAWRVSLARGFVALETKAYASRTDLLQRLREVLGAVVLHIGPKRVDRFGLRYVDRISGSAIEDINQLLRAEMRGIVTAEVAQHCEHSLTESIFTVDGARLLARWGLLPGGMTVDPTIEAVDAPSWVLDLDMFSSAPAAFEVEGVVDTAKLFAERIYTFFRWAVTPEFLRRFGGKP